MGTFDLQRLVDPVSPDDPCGPDLDLDGDAGYMNFMAGQESRLPRSFFDGKDESGVSGRPFVVSRNDLEAVFTAAAPMLAKTRDLRLLVLLAKFALLGRQFDDFLTLTQAIATLLSERWDDVHPRAEGGELQARQVAVESLETPSTVLMPLQFLTLLDHRRFGSINYRGYLIATGATAPREDEDVAQLSNIDKLVREIELPELIAKRGEFVALQSVLANMSRTWSEKEGSGAPLHIGALVELVGKIVTFLDGGVKLRDPSAALVPEGGGDAADSANGEAAPVEGMPGEWRVTNQSEAGAALTAVADYLSRNEPSSPTLPLVRQARGLVGKSFIEVMRTLVPTFFEQAAIDVGRHESFSLPIERLAALTGEGVPAAEEAAVDAEPAPEEAVVEEAPPPDGDTAAPEPVRSEPLRATESPLFAVKSRAQALSLLDQVAAYFRAAEPASPIPFLIERGRDLAQRDFLSVLKAILPADSLKASGGAS